MEKIQKLILFNESRCNLDCIYCYTYARRSRSNKISQKDSNLLIRQAKEMGAKSVMFAGPGEFLVDDKNLELIDYAYSEGLQPVVFTNGLVLDDRMIDYLYERKVGIILKLHSLNKKTYDNLAGINTVFKWKKYNFRYKGEEMRISIPEFLEKLIKEGYNSRKITDYLTNPLVKQPYVCIESVITKNNIKYLPIIAKLAKSQKMDFLIETLIITKEIREMKPGMIPSKEEYKKLKKELVSILGKRFEKTQDDCSCMINKNPVIYEDGTVSVCFVKSSDVNWFKDKSLAESFKVVSKNSTIPKINPKHGFRSCFGRESVSYDKKSDRD